MKKLIPRPTSYLGARIALAGQALRAASRKILHAFLPFDRLCRVPGALKKTMDSDIATASCGSDSGQPSNAEYASPDIGSAGASASGEAHLWSCDERDRRPQKMPKTCHKRRELHQNVELTPTQREALGRVVEKVDTESASVVVTDPLRQGAPRARSTNARGGSGISSRLMAACWTGRHAPMGLARPLGNSCRTLAGRPAVAAVAVHLSLLSLLTLAPFALSLADNPIVFVTQKWEEMCGFSYDQAVGRNPRLTQGQHSDPNTMQQIGAALRNQRSCKVMMLNYRGGLADRPFWNMLSISPVVHGGRLMFYLANLQDYTYHMAKLVSLSPAQFCRSAEHHQRVCRLPDRPADELHVRFFAKPAVFETDSNHPITEYQPSGQDAVPHLQMKVIAVPSPDDRPPPTFSSLSFIPPLTFLSPFSPPCRSAWAGRICSSSRST